MIVRSPGSTRRASPRRSLAAPVPPASAAIFMLAVAWVLRGAPSRGAPEGGASAPGEEAEPRPPPQPLGGRGLGGRDEPRADPRAVESLGAGEDGLDSLSGRVREPVGAEPRGDLEGVVRSEEHTSELQSQSNLVCPL